MPKAVRPETGAPEIVLAEHQPEYTPLPVAVYEDSQYNSPMFLCRYTFSDEERLAIANGEDLYIGVLTFNRRFQPIEVLVGPGPYKLRVSQDPSERPYNGNAGDLHLG